MKRALYARSGVREYWLVDPEDRTIELFSLGLGGSDLFARYELGDRLVSAVVEGFELALSEVFERT